MANKVKNLNSEKYRELVKIFSKYNPEISNIEIHRDRNENPNGIISFEVNTFDLGISAGVFHKYKRYIFSQFIIKFLVNLTIRENISMFLNVLTNFDMDIIDFSRDTYLPRCGLKITNSSSVFTFHISVLLEILQEEPINE